MTAACLDHLVVAAASLDQGAAYIREKLGVTMQPGGRHPLQGTHNLLMKLDRERYLEVIAIDPKGMKPPQPRWFGLDCPEVQAKVHERPRLIAWVARTADIDASVHSCTTEIGEIRRMSRGDLTWQITIPLDGVMPLAGLVPAVIEWNTDRHPSGSLPDSGCRLVDLEGYSPQPKLLEQALASLSLEKEMVVHPVEGRTEIGLRALFEAPAGTVVLD